MFETMKLRWKTVCKMKKQISANSIGRNQSTPLKYQVKKGYRLVHCNDTE